MYFMWIDQHKREREEFSGKMYVLHVDRSTPERERESEREGEEGGKRERGYP